MEPLRKVLVVFASRNDLDVQWLAANGERRSFAPGEQLITEGDLVDKLHILLDGDAEVFNSQENAEDLIGSSRPGEILGEMNLLTENHHAAASIRARTTMLTLCLPISSLQQRLRMDVSFKSRWFKALAPFHRNRDQLNVHGMAGNANQHELVFQPGSTQSGRPSIRLALSSGRRPRRKPLNPNKPIVSDPTGAASAVSIQFNQLEQLGTTTLASGHSQQVIELPDHWWEQETAIDSGLWLSSRNTHESEGWIVRQSSEAHKHQVLPLHNTTAETVPTVEALDLKVLSIWPPVTLLPGLWNPRLQPLLLSVLEAGLWLSLPLLLMLSPWTHSYPTNCVDPAVTKAVGIKATLVDQQSMGVCRVGNIGCDRLQSLVQWHGALGSGLIDISRRPVR